MGEFETTGSGSQDTHGETFEQLLNQYEYETPKRGSIVEGEIIRLDDDVILIDIGAKRDAIVPRKDLDRLDSELLSSLSKGDRLPVYVLNSPSRPDDDLLVSIRRGLEQEDWDLAVAHLDSGEPVELEVMGRNRGGVVVEFGRLRGFVPNSHIPGLTRGSSPDDLSQQKLEKVGEKLLLKVLEVNQDRQRLILSGRTVQHDRRHRRLEELEVDEVIKGRVVNLVDFGAFVDLGGVDGLIHISEIDWSRVDHPSQALKLGEEIEVKVIGIDLDRERISLSRKALLENPWERIEETYKEGDLIEGQVTNVRDFGAFVMLPEGIEGLIHTSELGMLGPGGPEDFLQPDDYIVAQIIEIDTDRQRLSLSLKQVKVQEPDVEAEEPVESSPLMEDEAEQIAEQGSAAIENPADDEKGQEPGAAGSTEAEPAS